MKPTDINIDTMLKRLHLANARRAWRAMIERAEAEAWSCRDFLAVLVAEEDSRSSRPSTTSTSPTRAR